MDVKPQNIFIDGHGTFKLGDFGVSLRLKNVRRNKPVGTISYMGPELLAGEMPSQKSDSYSLGCVLFELCTLEKLFSGQKPNYDDEGFGRIPNTFSVDLQTLIHSMLDPNPEMRPKISQILES